MFLFYQPVQAFLELNGKAAAQVKNLDILSVIES